jgi:hypothetical protein
VRGTACTLRDLAPRVHETPYMNAATSANLVDRGGSRRSRNATEGLRGGPIGAEGRRGTKGAARDGGCEAVAGRSRIGHVAWPSANRRLTVV